MNRERASRVKIDLDAARVLLDQDPANNCLPPTVQVLAAMGQWNEALKRARAGLRAHADRESVVLGLVWGALEGGRPDRAEKALGELPQNPKRRSEIVRVRVNTLDALGRHEEAYRVALKYVETDPEDAEVAGWVQAWSYERTLRSVQPFDTLHAANQIQRAGHPAAALRMARRVQLYTEPTEALISAIRDLVERTAQHSPDLPFDRWSGELIAMPYDAEEIGS